MNLDKLQIPAAEKNGESETTKSFTFRNLPLPLHTAWKTYAALAGVSMEEFAITAIQDYILQRFGKKAKPSAETETPVESTA